MNAKLTKSVRGSNNQQLQHFWIIDSIIEAAPTTDYDQACRIADAVLGRLQEEGAL